MKLQIDTVVQTAPRIGAAWGMNAETGEAVLVIVDGAKRIMLSMAPEEGLDVCAGGIYTAMGLRQMAAQRAGAQPPASMLVDPQGIPLASGRG
jgi:hypothetical protein